MERRNGAQIGHANGRGESAVLAESEPFGARENDDGLASGSQPFHPLLNTHWGGRDVRVPDPYASVAGSMSRFQGCLCRERRE